MKKILLILTVLFFYTVQVVKAEDDLNPLFVDITMKECYTCQKLKPVIEELENEYAGRITFITLDVSSRALLEESRQKAEDLGIKEFFEKNRNALPAIGIICPGGSKVKEAFQGESEIEAYRKALDVLLLDTSKLCSL